MIADCTKIYTILTPQRANSHMWETVLRNNYLNGISFDAYRLFKSSSGLEG
jgi:hypothetical protein